MVGLKIMITARARSSLKEVTGCFLEGDTLIRFLGEKLDHQKTRYQEGDLNTAVLEINKIWE